MQNFGFDKVNQPTKTYNTVSYCSYCVIVCLVLSATKYRDSTSWGYTGYLKFADRSDDLTGSVHLKYKSIWPMYKCTRGWQHAQALSMCYCDPTNINIVHAHYKFMFQKINQQLQELLTWLSLTFKTNYRNLLTKFQIF